MGSEQQQIETFKEKRCPHSRPKDIMEQVRMTSRKGGEEGLARLCPYNTTSRQSPGTEPVPPVGSAGEGCVPGLGSLPPGPHLEGARGAHPMT